MHIARKTGKKEWFFRLLGSRSTNKSKDMNNIKVLTWVKWSENLICDVRFYNFGLKLLNKCIFCGKLQKSAKNGFLSKKVDNFGTNSTSESSKK